MQSRWKTWPQLPQAIDRLFFSRKRSLYDFGVEEESESFPLPPADLGPKKEEKRNQREKNVFLSLSLSTHPGWSASPLGFAWYSIDGS